MLFALAIALLMQTAQSSPSAAPNPSLNAPYDSALERRTREVSSVLRCPVCQGLSIQDSPSELSVQMKDVVRQQLRAGKSEAEVKAYFVSKYGEWILLEPKASGMNMIVYGLPVLLVIGGAGFIWMMVKKWSAGGSTVVVESEEESLV
jgi:cytochrome c-type biogenesis protein CcmH